MTSSGPAEVSNTPWGEQHCYVLDFSPNRSLRLIVEYATKLRAGGNLAEFDEAVTDWERQRYFERI